ncbi:MAG TPA: hypothetical protein VE621_24155 [Bryobacteraceae bacterium]|nr:hypothetical protein [Bryobacteraceae bacterium]
MTRLLSRGLIVFTGLVAAPFVQFINAASHSPRVPVDERVILLKQFFGERDAPAAAYADDFVRAADGNGLDWRLLPGIAYVESGGGKLYKNNNIFGWNNAGFRFASIRDSIYHVASRLRLSRLYRGKDTREILLTYNNGDTDYQRRVTKVMRAIGPEPEPLVSFD